MTSGDAGGGPADKASPPSRSPESPEDSVRSRLADLHARLAKMDGDRLETMQDAAALSREARQAGVPITEIARLLGFSRPTVYALINERGTS